jgi:GNAT superfamily N-acetyltransferase
MSYEYLVHRNLSKKQVIERYEPFTFPSFLQKSKARNLQEPFFVIEAMQERQRVGLAVLELLHQEGILKVLSLLVKEEYRKQGIATQILKIAEKVAFNNQLMATNIIFQNNWDSFKIMPQLLKKLDWNEPQKRMILVKLSYNQVKDLSWFQIKDYPQGFSVKPWLSLAQEDYDFIRQKQAREQWYPPMLSPFQLPDLVTTEGSLALFYQNELVGWFITHLTNHKTIQITSYFIDPAHRKTKASIALIVDSISKIYENGTAEQALFMFEANNKNMIGLAKKMAGEHNTGAFTEVWVGQKKVG